MPQRFTIRLAALAAVATTTTPLRLVTIVGAAADAATAAPPPPPPWSGPLSTVEPLGVGGAPVIAVNGRRVSPVFLSLNPFATRNWTVFRYEVSLAVAAGVDLIELCLTEATSAEDLATLDSELRLAGYGSGSLMVRVALDARAQGSSLEVTAMQGTADGRIVPCNASLCPATPYTLSDAWVAEKRAALRATLARVDAAFPGRVAIVRPTYLNGGEWFYVMVAGGQASSSDAGVPVGSSFSSGAHTRRALFGGAGGGSASVGEASAAAASTGRINWLFADYSADANASLCAWEGMPAALRGCGCGIPSVATRWHPTIGNTFLGGDGSGDDVARAVWYNRFLSHRVSSAMVAMAEEVKNITSNRALTMFFYGYLFELDAVVGNGHAGGVAALLSSPAVDIMSAPYSYGRARTLDIGLSPHGVSDAPAVRSKPFVFEDDTRTVLCNASDPDQKKWRLPTIAASVAMVRRNGVTALLRGNSLYYFDLSSRGWFGRPDQPAASEAIWEGVRSVLGVGRNLSSSAGGGARAFRPQVAVFADEWSPSHASVSGVFGATGAVPDNALADAFGRRATDALTQLGAPVRLQLLSDIEQGGFDAASLRLAVVLNAFSLSGAARAAVKSKLIRSGVTVVFVHAAGFLDTDTLAASADGVADLVGMDVRLGTGTANLTTVVTAPLGGLAPGAAFGVSVEVAPWFYVAPSPDVDVHGAYAGLTGGGCSDASGASGAGSHPSLAVRASPSGGRVVWTGAPDPGSDLFRAVAATTPGLHLFSNVSTDVVEGGGNTLMIFTTMVAGVRAVTLPWTVPRVVLVGVDGSETPACPGACAGFDAALEAGKVYVWRWE